MYALVLWDMVMCVWCWGWWCIEFPLPPKGEVKFNTSDVAVLSTPRLPPNQSPLLRPKAKEGQQLVMMICWVMLMWWWVWCVCHKMAAKTKRETIVKWLQTYREPYCWQWGDDNKHNIYLLDVVVVWYGQRQSFLELPVLFKKRWIQNCTAADA